MDKIIFGRRYLPHILQMSLLHGCLPKRFETHEEKEEKCRKLQTNKKLTSCIVYPIHLLKDNVTMEYSLSHPSLVV